MPYVFLSFAIVFELVGTSFLKASEGFSKPVEAVVTVIAYVLCFFFLSLAIKVIPLGIAYAIWGGLGIVLTAIVSIVIFKQPLDLPAILGIVLIVGGVLVMNFFSKAISH